MKAKVLKNIFNSCERGTFTRQMSLCPPAIAGRLRRDQTCKFRWSRREWIVLNRRYIGGSAPIAAQRLWMALWQTAEYRGEFLGIL